MRASVARALESPANRINPVRPILERNMLRRERRRETETTDEIEKAVVAVD
jgi:hypothetical protein